MADTTQENPEKKSKKDPDILNGFVDYLQRIKGLSDRTIYHYLTYHNHFMHKELTQENIDKFAGSKKNNSVCRGYLRSYLEYLKRTKDFNLPPTKSGSQKKRLIRPLSQKDLENIRDTAYKRKKRYGILFDLVYFGALRRIEVQTIKINSFNWEEWFKDPSKFCQFTVIGKRDKERSILVHPKAVKILLDLLFQKGFINNHMPVSDIINKLNNTDDRLFKRISERRVYEIIKKISTKAIGRDVRPHEVRHARATDLENKGASIRDIQKYLGHSSVTTTEIYLHSDEVKSLKNIQNISEKEE